MKSIYYLLFALVICWSTAAVAGNTGKIAGEIKDGQTGETLVGANVLIEGTSMGAASNLDGYFVILNVQPGKYTLVASAVGYNKKTISNVQVSIDLTTTIDFKLNATVLEMGEEIVTIAQRPLVQKDLTASTAIVNGDQISALPVTEVGQVLSLQAGFVAGSLRGGRSGEVAYWIDGVPVTDGFNGQQVVEVNKSMVQELQLVSGAFNAEYGQAMSGVVNIATKEGSSKFSGSAGGYIGTYLPDNTTLPDSNALYPGFEQVRPFSIRNIEGSLSGPVLGDNLTFFANGRYIYFDGDLYGFRRFNPQNIAYTDSANNYRLFRDPAGKGDSTRVPMNSSERYYGQGKLTWRISPVLKVTGNYIYDYTKSRPYGPFSTGYRRYYYDPDGMGNDYNTSNTFIVQLSHSVNPTTFYTLGGSVFVKKYKHYLYEDPFDPRYTHPKLQTLNDSWSFYTGGTDLYNEKRWTATYLGKLDISSQLNQSNLLKAGVEFRKHRVFYDSYTLQPILSQSDIDLAKGNPFITTQIPDLSSLNHSKYEHRPMELSGYVQDKLELKDLIVNFGIRYDYFEPDGVVLADPSDPNIYSPIKPSNRFFDANGNGIQDPGEASKTVDDRRAYWYTKASSKWKISPRIGFSFPITARGIVHFSYGHFFQTPRFERLYENPDFKIGFGTGNQGLVGNADLQPEETINGELGVQQQITDDISIDVTAYLRDIRNLTGTRSEEIVVFGGATSYNKYTNSDFGFVKGIVLTANKRFSAGLSATLDYTFQIAKGSASNPQDARNAVTGGGRPEVQLNPLEWDQTHTVNVTLSYAVTHWGASTIVQYGSGTPYTPRRFTDITALLTNSQAKPSFFNMDLRAYYEFTVSTIKLVAFARVFNIFDIRNETGVYDDTGRSGITIDESRARATNPNQRVNTLDQWFHVPTQYSEPRRIELGMNLEF